MNEVVLGVIGYVGLQFAIGAWVSRRIATEKDYINAGRRIGPVVGAFSVFATWFGAEAIVGTAGQVYETGLAGAEVDPFGYALALCIAGFAFAAVLWRRGLTTFADFFRSRYGAGVEKLVVLVLLPGSIFWAAAQIRAFGQVVSSVSDIGAPLAITGAAVAVVAYTVLGGLLADAVTDLVQGIAIIIGLLVLALLAASELGGVAQSLAAVPADRLRIGEGDLLQLVERYAVPICGTIVAVGLLSRMLGCRSAEVARTATVSGGVLYLAVGLIPVYLGLIGPGLAGGLAGEEVEQVVPHLAGKLMPGALFILFAGALISAILSTVDSILLASASQVSHNIVMRLRPEADERVKLLSARLSVIGLAVVAYALALTASSIRDLVEVASAAGSPGLLVCLLFGLPSNFGGAASAAAAIVAGTAVWVFGYISGFTDVPYLAALAAAFGAYLLGAFVARDRISEG